MKSNTLHTWKRGLGDRYDGWRVRRLDALFALIPYIMGRRTESEVAYSERIEIDSLERFVREHRERIEGLSIMHVVMAAMLRVLAQKPRLNRFVVHNKIFARNSVDFVLAVKRSMTEDGEETVIKLPLRPEYTLEDVSRVIREEFERSKPQGKTNSADNVSRVFNRMPSWLIRPVVWAFRVTDRYGVLPRFIHSASPWHSSLFMTNLGSLGVESAYHHLTEFGTCSLFVAMGRKSYSYIPDAEGNMVKHKSITLRLVLDERICDGFYYAGAMRLMSQILASPEVLLTSPARVALDDGVAKKPID